MIIRKQNIKNIKIINFDSEHIVFEYNSITYSIRYSSGMFELRKFFTRRLLASKAIPMVTEPMRFLLAINKETKEIDVEYMVKKLEEIGLVEVEE